MAHIIDVYDETSISTENTIIHVQNRPTMYIPDTEIAGQLHVILELIANAVDEMVLNPDRGKVDVVICRDPSRNTYQVIIRDNGRGVPIGSMVAVYTKLQTSGKFKAGAYITAAGLFGVGAKASSGTSEHFRSVSKRPEGTGSIYIHRCTWKDRPDTLLMPNTETGTTVVMEPDPAIFTDIVAFAETGYFTIVTLLKKYCFLNKYNITFAISEKPFPKKGWTCSIPEFQATIDKILTNSQLIFSEADYNREEWIRSYWNVTRPFAWAFDLSGRAPEGALEYKAKLYYVKFDANGGRLGLVNTVPIDAAKSNHLSILQDEITQILSTKIEDQAVRKFFQEIYRLPIYIAVDVKYPGAEFSGTTKNGFISAPFRELYSSLVRPVLMSAEGSAALQELFLLLTDDINSKYQASLASTTKVVNSGQLFKELNFYKKFKDCMCKDRSNAELFIMEGDSAGGVTGYDTETMGIYTIRGKPTNCLSYNNDDPKKTLARITEDPIYQDLIKIIGLNPYRPDLSKLYFSRILITTDADAHGQHISSILVSNFYALCPALVENGHIYVVTPPYYGVTYGKNKTFYLREALDFIRWMTQNVYQPNIGIGVRATGVYETTRWLKTTSPMGTKGLSEYESFILVLLKAGEAIESAANDLVISPMILELLTEVTEYLTPTTMNVEAIKSILGHDEILYEEDGHILTISVGNKDYIIPLMKVRELLDRDVLPILNRMAWRKLTIYITSLRTSHFKDIPNSVYQLYSYLKSFEEQFTIKNFKGLGGMPKADLYRTCMDPQYRTVFQVKGVGDVETIYHLLGANSDQRKLLSERTES